MLTVLEKLYFFSEEKNDFNIRDEQYVICMDNPATLLIKLYKQETCCEYCYLRGHTMANCKKQIKRNRRLPDDQELTEEDFWGPPQGDENTNLIYLTPQKSLPSIRKLIEYNLASKIRWETPTMHRQTHYHYVITNKHLHYYLSTYKAIYYRINKVIIS